jgi:hypothetical protein
MTKPLTPEEITEVADRCKYVETNGMAETGLQEICTGFLQLQAENELLNRCMSCEGIIDKPIVQCGCCAGIAYNNCDCSVTKQRDQAIADVKKLRNLIKHFQDEIYHSCNPEEDTNYCWTCMCDEGLDATKHYDD